MKRLIRILCVVLVLSLLPLGSFAGAYEQPETRLLNIYGDGMLFKQKEEAVFEGTCLSGAEIHVELVSPLRGVIEKNKTIASKSGTFTVTLPAPEGSYTGYSVRFYENGTLFRELKDVLFGELWLASGQSNMQYSLAQDVLGAEMMKNGTALNTWIRALFVPAVTPYQGSDAKVPVDPQKDIEGAHWVKSDNPEMFSVSAVAYHFADRLQKELDMPVGILNSALGGSSIATWLSRNAIDGDEAVKNDFLAAGEYIPVDNWKEDEQSQYYDMTANYDLKINALRNFRLSGMIWYQGETDIMFGWKNGRYSRAFDLMQRSYTEDFRYENGLLPIIYTSLAAYYYGDDDSLAEMNAEFTAMQKARPESRALISIYDVSPFFFPEVGAIHPSTKQPVGDRMAYCALGMVYGSRDTYTAAVVKNTEIADGSVYVTLEHTGKGLVCGGARPAGFAVAGADGIYTEAEAEIISPDTVRIYSPYVAEPVSASYAYTINSLECNLYAEDEDGTLIPAALFITDPEVNGRTYWFASWTNCETAQTWHNTSSGDRVGYQDVWSAENAQLAIAPEAAFSGANGLSVTSESKKLNKKFSVSPVLSYKENLSTETYSDVQTDYSDYGKLVFRVRNDGEAPVTLSEVRFYTSAVTWYAPVLAYRNDVSFTVAADGKWHEVICDLNALHFDSNEGGAVYSNKKLDDIREIRFCFENSEAGTAKLSLDEFRFISDGGNADGVRFEDGFSASDSVFELITSFFTRLIRLILSVFAPLSAK